MGITVDALFFIGSQLVAISRTGKVVVWHAMTHHWQVHKHTDWSIIMSLVIHS